MNPDTPQKVRQMADATEDEIQMIAPFLIYADDYQSVPDFIELCKDMSVESNKLSH